MSIPQPPGRCGPRGGQFFASLPLLLATLLCAGTGCKKERTEPRSPPAASVAATASSAGPGNGDGNVVVRDSAGTVVCKLKPKGADFKVYDGSGAVLGKVRDKSGAEAGKLKLRGPDKATIWKLKVKAYGAKITDGADAELYKLKKDVDALKLKDTGGTTVLKLKPAGEGYKLKDGDGGEVARAERSGAGVTVSTTGAAAGATLAVSGPMGPRAAVWFGASRLTWAQRAALAVLMHKELVR